VAVAVLVASHQGRRLVVVAVVVVLMLFCRDHALPVLMEVCSCHHHRHLRCHQAHQN
jgi:hypothetical protein